MSSVVAERSRATNLKISIDVMFIVRGSFRTSRADPEDFKPQMDASKRKGNFWDPAGLVFIHVHLRFFYVQCGS